MVSPNFPLAYSTFQNCYWNIYPQACQSGQTIQVLLEYLDLPSSHSLNFKIGSTTIATLTGTKENVALTFNTCRLNVYFDAYVYVTPGKGWQFTYKRKYTTRLPTNRSLRVNQVFGCLQLLVVRLTRFQRLPVLYLPTPVTCTRLVTWCNLRVQLVCGLPATCRPKWPSAPATTLGNHCYVR